MKAELTSELVWRALEKNGFGVVGMVTERHEARTAGVIYVVRDHKLYIATDRYSWKARHISENSHVSVTIPVPKRILFLPWIKIPAATITFSASAKVMAPGGAPLGIAPLLFRGLEGKQKMLSESCVIEVVPEKDFVTYGIGMPLFDMRRPEKARGRVSVVPASQPFDIHSSSSA